MGVSDEEKRIESFVHDRPINPAALNRPHFVKPLRNRAVLPHRSKRKPAEGRADAGQ
jgi:hypothetical protein